jgi:hypothetical protein
VSRSGVLFALGASALAAVAWQFLLPAVSRDAHYFRDVYAHRNYVIRPRELLLDVLPVLTLFVAFLALAPRLRDSLRSQSLWLLGGSLPLLVIGFAYRALPPIPNPAHWTRVYPVALIGLAALALPPVRKPRIALAITAVLVAIGLADTSLATFDMAHSYGERLAPVAIDRDESGLISELRHLPPRRVIYIRPCSGVPGAGPELEYSISVLTDQRPPFGHIDFSPNMARDLARFRTCHVPKRIDAANYAVVDARTAAEWPAQYPRRPFGRFVLLMPQSS